MGEDPKTWMNTHHRRRLQIEHGMRGYGTDSEGGCIGVRGTTQFDPSRPTISNTNEILDGRYNRLGSAHLY